MTPPDLLTELSAALVRRGWMLACAESCTGGLIAACCTDQPGSSAWFDRGFVTYSNQAKVEMLGVPLALIEQHGAVSAPVAEAMVRGALQHSHAEWAVAVTGIAGPGGGTTDKPVGTVWLALAQRDQAAKVVCLHASGRRSEIRAQAVRFALDHLGGLVGSATA
ncbi:CinA family protein [Leptothrix ochracea]|uniref:CinA family protein n=1 Tax=Leptothrix ochracea TaxID=735331 RepID=UPI0034E21D12